MTTYLDLKIGSARRKARNFADEGRGVGREMA